LTSKPAPLVVASLCLAILIPMSAAAGPIDAPTAAIVAKNYVLRMDTTAGCTVGTVQSLRNPETGVALCYVFDLQPQGYIVVSADTALPPVVAYSFTGDAGCDLTPGNPLADLLTWDLQSRLDHAALLPPVAAAWTEYLQPAPAAPRDRLFQQWPPAGSTSTGGWLLTNWTQDSPYKDLCPLDLAHGGRSLAGCPAVAMAQIINYHARLNGVHFTDADDYYHNYNGNAFSIDNAYVARQFPSWPQLNTYLHTLFDAYFHGTALTNTNKAALVYACGVAAEQVYGASGSGTFAVAQAFQGLQKFGCTTAALLDANDPNLDHDLSKNMKNAVPALLAIVNAGWTSGHNLVVDGYNTNGYYHLNFGWGGSYNGWYLIPSGLPFSLTVIEGVIIDIMTDPCEPMDCTCDGAVAWEDFTYLAGCLSGPAVAYGPPGCTAFDNNADGDTDLADFSTFQTLFGS
jgi:hypothetical protein